MIEEFDGDLFAMLAVLMSFILLLIMFNFLDQRHDTDKSKVNDAVAVSSEKLDIKK